MVWGRTGPGGRAVGMQKPPWCRCWTCLLSAPANSAPNAYCACCERWRRGETRSTAASQRNRILQAPVLNKHSLGRSTWCSRPAAFARLRTDTGQSGHVHIHTYTHTYIHTYIYIYIYYKKHTYIIHDVCVCVCVFVRALFVFVCVRLRLNI